MIVIGTNLGGPELKRSRILSRIVDLCEALRTSQYQLGVSSMANVRLDFCISGSLVRFDFDGIQHTDYSAIDHCLNLAVVVPADVLLQANPTEFLIESLHGANANAFEFFRQRGVEYPLASLEALVMKISRMLDCFASDER